MNETILKISQIRRSPAWFVAVSSVAAYVASVAFTILSRVPVPARPDQIMGIAKITGWNPNAELAKTFAAILAVPLGALLGRVVYAASRRWRRCSDHWWFGLWATPLAALTRSPPGATLVIGPLAALLIWAAER